ncbi:CD63 antigen-like [Ostrea edulis]|uniref:CD63 antigen-like n=1 Tax=Ostrea edulis TaxID=37623 RepID=UPI0020942ACE|nr:CD63 antigen-like [Ostrea edulis]XP_056012290.1 CD63 antigen-like [Ostrea edulis]
MVEGGMKCVKILLFIFNLVFVIAGAGLIGAGAAVQIKFKDYFALLGGQFSSAAALLIAVGVIIFFIALFGCIGAWKENHCCVMIYAVLLIIIFILEISAGIAGYVYHGEVETEVKKLMGETQQQYKQGGDKSEVWNTIQKEFKCCGISNYTEWYSVYNETKVPSSCCMNSTCTGLASDIPGNIYTEGCLTKFENYVKDNIFIVGGVGIGLAFVQIVGILFAFCLARALKKEYEVV